MFENSTSCLCKLTVSFKNLQWGGAKMRDVLEYCGLDCDGIALGKVPTDDITYVESVML